MFNIINLFRKKSKVERPLPTFKVGDYYSYSAITEQSIGQIIDITETLIFVDEVDFVDKNDVFKSISFTKNYTHYMKVISKEEYIKMLGEQIEYFHKVYYKKKIEEVLTYAEKIRRMKNYFKTISGND